MLEGMQSLEDKKKQLSCGTQSEETLDPWTEILITFPSLTQESTVILCKKKYIYICSISMWIHSFYTVAAAWVTLQEVQTSTNMFPFLWGFKEIQMNAKEQSKHTLHRLERHSSAEQKKNIYFMKLYKQPWPERGTAEQYLTNPAVTGQMKSTGIHHQRKDVGVIKL